MRAHFDGLISKYCRMQRRKRFPSLLRKRAPISASWIHAGAGMTNERTTVRPSCIETDPGSSDSGIIQN